MLIARHEHSRAEWSLRGNTNPGDRWRFVLLLYSALFANLGEFGIQFCSQKHGKARPIQPCHQSNRGTQGAIGLVEVCEMAEIHPEQIRQRSEEHTSELQ